MSANHPLPFIRSLKSSQSVRLFHSCYQNVGLPGLEKPRLLCIERERERGRSVLHVLISIDITQCVLSHASTEVRDLSLLVCFLHYLLMLMVELCHAEILAFLTDRGAKTCPNTKRERERERFGSWQAEATQKSHSLCVLVSRIAWLTCANTLTKMASSGVSPSNVSVEPERSTVVS